jgi:hypothetical protein
MRARGTDLVIGMQVIDIRKIGSIDLLSTLKSGF